MTRVKRILFAVLLLGVSRLLAGDLDLKQVQRVNQLLESNYVEKTLDSRALQFGAIKGLLEALKDPYTRFLEPKRYADMTARMQGHFFGIGITVGIRKDQLVVVAPMEGTPAQKAGILPMDKILKIDGVSTKGLSVEEAVGSIRGPKGTTVTLTLMRVSSDNIWDVTIIRDQIKVRSVDRVTAFGPIGYIHIATFEPGETSEDVAKAIAQLKSKGIRSMVVDVRNNGGGLLSQGIGVSNLFLAKGEIVHRLDRNGSRQTEMASGKPVFEGPLAVLINEGSASSSEIFAGAIKDNQRGILVGTHSFGKASVQSLIPLEDGSAVLITIQKYLTPNGTDISKKGLTVNIEIQAPSANVTANQGPYRYETDEVLQRVLRLPVLNVK